MHRRTACLLIIGDEILSGRIQDANIRPVATELNELGVELQEVRVIPDQRDAIVSTLEEVRRKFDIVVTTGGIGPTHDDITVECVAECFKRPVVFHPEIVPRIEAFNAPEELVPAMMLMARTPEGSTIIDNPTGGPQGFQIENVFVLAGVPSVMKHMLSTLTRERLGGGLPKRSREIGVYLAEVVVADILADQQKTYPQLSIGSYPFYDKNVYGTNVVMRGTDEVALDTLTADLRRIFTDLNGTFVN